MGMWAADRCLTESAAPTTGLQICGSLSSLFTFGAHPHKHIARQLGVEGALAGAGVLRQRSQEIPRNFYPTLAPALLVPPWASHPSSGLRPGLQTSSLFLPRTPLLPAH